MFCTQESSVRVAVDSTTMYSLSRAGTSLFFVLLSPLPFILTHPKHPHDSSFQSLLTLPSRAEASESSETLSKKKKKGVM